MTTIPKQFNQYGLLNPGDYVVNFDQLRKSILVKGPKNKLPTWDRDWRNNLVDNLEILVQELRKVGITEIFIDGSFVEDKDHPNDIDGYFECDPKRLASGELPQELNLLNKHKVWTWDRAARTHDRNSGKKQLPMWHMYRVELYPHCGQPSGILDEFGNQQQFPAAFRKSRREHRQKGIIKIA